MWLEKMKRAVRRGIDGMEELDRVKREEAAEEERRRATEAVPSSSDVPVSSGDFTFDWNDVCPTTELDPSVLASFSPPPGTPLGPVVRSVNGS